MGQLMCTGKSAWEIDSYYLTQLIGSEMYTESKVWLLVPPIHLKVGLYKLCGQHDERI